MGILGDRLATKRWIRERARIYANRVSLGYVPRVAFSEEEFARLVGTKDFKQGRFIKESEKGVCDPYLAKADDKWKAILINLDKQLCRHDADDTVGHEITHMRFPHIGHPDRFYKAVKAIKEGKKLGPPGSKLPSDFRNFIYPK